jgi:hypothetical protein
MKIELILKNSKLQIYYLMSWIIALLNIIAQFAIVLTFEYSVLSFLPFIGVIALLLSLRKAKVEKPDQVNKRKIVATALAWSGVVWIAWGFYWLVALNTVLLILYVFATRKFLVSVSEKMIAYPSFPKRQIQWNELQNVIMKDGLLTIDFKNNKLLQAETEEDSFNEKEFNEFCREQLRK